MITIGIISDGRNVSREVYDLINALSKEPEVSALHLLECRTPSLGIIRRALRVLRRNGLYMTISKVAFKALSIAERVALWLSDRDAGDWRLYDISQFCRDSIVLRPIVSRSGYVYEFTRSDVETIRAYNFDILLRCGSGILTGKILNSSRLGILSIHHGDNRVNRGGPPGFWEVYEGRECTGFTIQRLTEELDGGDALFRGLFPTRLSWLMNRTNIINNSTPYFLEVIKSVAKSGALPNSHPATPYSGQLYRTPLLHQIVRYVFLVSRMVIASHMRKRKWHVAFCNSGWRNSVLRTSIEIESLPDQFIADPFVVENGGRHFCFVEEFVNSDSKARIAVYEIKRGSAVRLGIAIDEDFHISFPFVFSFESNLYMCPESHANRDIRLYRCVRFPLEWRYVGALLSNVDAGDSMVFEYGEWWWLATNIDRLGSGNHDSELQLFYAKSPLSAEWTPHEQNPIIVDSTRARNGGLIQEAGKLFRVGQGQGHACYGKRVGVYEITDLSPHNYAEELISVLEPSFRNGVHGIHHLHTNGQVTVFDFLA